MGPNFISIGRRCTCRYGMRLRHAMFSNRSRYPLEADKIQTSLGQCSASKLRSLDACFPDLRHKSVADMSAIMWGCSSWTVRSGSTICSSLLGWKQAHGKEPGQGRKAIVALWEGARTEQYSIFCGRAKNTPRARSLGRRRKGCSVDRNMNKKAQFAAYFVGKRFMVHFVEQLKLGQCAHRKRTVLKKYQHDWNT